MFGRTFNEQPPFRILDIVSIVDYSETDDVDAVYCQLDVPDEIVEKLDALETQFMPPREPEP